MAAPATHIVFAEAFLQTAPELSPDTFIVGTSFPDIRYLGSIARETTHPQPQDLAAIRQGASAFASGVEFHNYIDIARNTYWEQSELYQQLPQSPYLQQALKFYEDTVLYDKLLDWPRVASYFKPVLDEEQAYGVAHDEILQWHDMLARYVSQRPSLETAKSFMMELQLDSATATAIIGLAHTIAARTGVKQAVHNLYDTLIDTINSDTTEFRSGT